MTLDHSTDITAIRADLQDILITSVGLRSEVFAHTPDDSLENLGVDSLAAAELQEIVRQRYNSRIPDESLGMSVLDVARHIRSDLSGVR